MIHNTTMTNALNRMILTHFLEDDISESTRYQLKLIEEETDALKLNWTRLAHLYFDLNEAWKKQNHEQIHKAKTRLFNEVIDNYPLVYELIMLDVFG